MSRIEKMFEATVSLLALVSTAACSWFGGGANKVEPAKEEISVRVAMDRPSYRPGEAALATVEITNVSDREMTIRYLNFDSLRFYFATTEKKVSFRRPPVYSKNEIPLQYDTMRLAPGAKEQRAFVLTRLTEEAGEYVLTVGYSPNVAALPDLPAAKQESSDSADNMPLCWSNPIVYQVAGDRAWRRDSKGVLLKEDAIDLCLKRLGRPASNIETDLIWNEAGFLDWWVCLTLSPETLASGEPAKYAWFVNPYLARIHKQAPVRLTLLEPKAKDATRVVKRVPAAEPGALEAGSLPVAAPGLGN